MWYTFNSVALLLSFDGIHGNLVLPHQYKPNTVRYSFAVEVDMFGAADKNFNNNSLAFLICFLYHDCNFVVQSGYFNDNGSLESQFTSSTIRTIINPHFHFQWIEMNFLLSLDKLPSSWWITHFYGVTSPTNFNYAYNSVVYIHNPTAKILSYRSQIVTKCLMYESLLLRSGRFDNFRKMTGNKPQRKIEVINFFAEVLHSVLGTVRPDLLVLHRPPETGMKLI